MKIEATFTRLAQVAGLLWLGNVIIVPKATIPAGKIKSTVADPVEYWLAISEKIISIKVVGIRKKKENL